jgi:hypothetical protein
MNDNWKTSFADVRKLADELKRRFPKFEGEDDDEVVDAALSLGLITLPQAEILPSVTSAHHSDTLQADFHPKRGLFAEWHAKHSAGYAKHKADEMESIYRLQRAANDAISESYATNLRVTMLQANGILQGEQIRTGIEQQKAYRVLQDSALKNVLTLDSHQSVIVSKKNIDLRLEEKQKETVIAWKDHEQRERLRQELIEQHIDREVQGTIQLANTDELARQQKVGFLREYNKQILEEQNEANRNVLELEIKRFTQELYGERIEPHGWPNECWERPCRRRSTARVWIRR